MWGRFLTHHYTSYCPIFNSPCEILLLYLKYYSVCPTFLAHVILSIFFLLFACMSTLCSTYQSFFCSFFFFRSFQNTLFFFLIFIASFITPLSKHYWPYQLHHEKYNPLQHFLSQKINDYFLLVKISALKPEYQMLYIMWAWPVCKVGTGHEQCSKCHSVLVCVEVICLAK